MTQKIKAQWSRIRTVPGDKLIELEFRDPDPHAFYKRHCVWVDRDDVDHDRAESIAEAIVRQMNAPVKSDDVEDAYTEGFNEGYKQALAEIRNTLWNMQRQVEEAEGDEDGEHHVGDYPVRNRTPDHEDVPDELDAPEEPPSAF